MVYGWVPYIACNLDNISQLLQHEWYVKLDTYTFEDKLRIWPVIVAYIVMIVVVIMWWVADINCHIHGVVVIIWWVADINCHICGLRLSSCGG